MIDLEYGLNADANALSADFKQNLFSTKEIDLEGKYINIRNLNGLLKEILDTLYEYYKGNVLTFTEGLSYKEGAVVQYNSNLYYVKFDTDPLENPETQPEAYKLLTPNVAQMIEEARVKMTEYVDSLNDEVHVQLNHLGQVDENLDSKIELNTQRFENLLQSTNNKFDETMNEFAAIREILVQHGIINDQEDNFISELQTKVADIIATNQRQDTLISDIQDKNLEQDNRLDAIETVNTAQEAHLSTVDETLEEHANLEARDKTLIDGLRTDHDTLRSEYDAFKEDQLGKDDAYSAKFQELDETDGNLRNDVNTNTTSIERIDDFITNLRTDLDNEVNLQSDNFTDLDNRVRALRNDLTDQTEKEENDRKNLQDSIDLINELDVEQDTRLQNLEDGLSNTSQDHETRISSLETRADTNDTDISSLRNEDELLRDFLERLEENVGTNNSIITDIQERLEDLKNTTSENNTTLVQVTDDHTTDISQIKEVNNTQDTRLEALETKLASGGLSDVALQQLRTTLKNDIDTAAENTKKGLYEEITGTGKEGEYLRLKYSETNGRNEVESTPLITFAKVATNQEQVDALKLEPVGMSTVFNTWYRFSHWRNEQNISGNTGHDMGGRMGDCPNNWSGWEHQTARNKWSYNPSNKMICSNRNSPVYGAFVSPRKLANWYLKLLAYGGGDGDNDGILINLAYMKGEDGVEHTIDLVRAVMGKGNGIYLDNVQMRHQWSIVYDYNMNTEFELATNTYIQPKSGGWGTQYCCFSAQRTKTNFKCYTSQIGGRVETVDPKSEINWTLPLTKPSNYSDAMYANLKTMMENPAQMGVGAHSQNGLFTILDQKYIFDDEKIYDFVSNTIWEYDEPTRLWNSVGKCSDMLDGFVYSRITEDLYYIDNGKAINVNNASTLVTESRVQELIDQLASEVQERDTETLTSSKEYTDAQITEKLQELKTLIETTISDGDETTLTSSKEYTDTKVQELDGTLRTHVQERLEELTTSAEFTELKTKVKSLEDENTELKNRVRTLEDYMSSMEIKDVEVDGSVYTLVVAKETQDVIIPQIERLNTKIFEFTLESNGVKEFNKEDLNLKDITDLGYSVYVKNIDETSAYYGKYTTAELLSDNYIDDDKVVIINTSKFTLEFKVVFRR